MSMSACTKAAWPLIWTECDDQGAFEWKPVVLQARILPADAVDFADILSELVRLGCVIEVEIDGRSYGLVRNFAKFQRPKKPQYRVLVPHQYRTYVGIGTEPVRNQWVTSAEKSPQMEDEGSTLPSQERNKPRQGTDLTGEGGGTNPANGRAAAAGDDDWPEMPEFLRRAQ